MSDGFDKSLNEVFGSSRGAGLENHDFFKPLNDMDPLIRKEKKMGPIPEFNFRVFWLSGGEDNSIEDSRDYHTIMNKIVRGECIRLDEQTYHSKDGDIKVFLRWVEFSKEDKAKMAAEEKKREEEEAKKDAEELLAQTEKADKKKKKKRTKDELEEEAIRKSCPVKDPEIEI